MKISVSEGKIKDALDLERKIPEFEINFTEEDFNNRLANKDSVILIAKVDDRPVGYLVAYDRFEDGSIYLWNAGVEKDFRKLGIFIKLMEVFEKWSRDRKYKDIKIKTMNRFKGMLNYLINHNFNIIDLDADPDYNKIKILFKKDL